MAFTPKSVIEQVEALYIGYFGRAGEPAGVQYWIDQIQAGRSFAQVAAAFSVQAEAKAQHPFLAIPDIVGPAEFVESLYLQLFGRQSDLAGKTYWVNQLTAAQDNPFSYGLLIAQFISGAQGDDVTVIQNKIDAAKYFTSHLGMAGKYGVDANGHVLADVDNAATLIIGSVTKDSASVTAANLKTDGFLAGTFPEPIVVPDQAKTFILTSAPDLLTGTTSNDTFIGVVDANGGPVQTFSAVDQLDGGDGIDRLNVFFDAAPSAIFPDADIKNIELLYLRNISGHTLEVDLSTLSGVTEVWNDRSTSPLHVANLREGMIFGVNGFTQNTQNADDDEVNYASTAATAIVTLANGTARFANYLNLSGENLTSLIINSVGEANSFYAIDVEEGAIDAITINAQTDLKFGGSSGIYGASGLVDGLTMHVGGAGYVDLQGLSNSVGAFDASQNTGGVRLYLNKNIQSFIGSQGNDIVRTNDLKYGAANFIDAGNGRDTLVIGDDSDVNSLDEVRFYRGFEIIDVGSNEVHVGRFTNSMIDSVHFGNGAHVFGLTAALALNLTVYQNITAAEIDISGSSNNSNDKLKIDVNDLNAARTTITIDKLDTENIESVEFLLTDNLTIKSLALMPDTTLVKFSGSGNLNLDAGKFVPAVGLEIDASGVSGTVTIDASKTQANPSITIRAGSGVADITGAGGADLIIGGSGGGVYNGGFGADTINITASIGKSDLIEVDIFDSGFNLIFDKISGFTNGLTNGDTLDFNGFESDSTVAPNVQAGTASISQANLTVTAVNGLFTFGGSAAANAQLIDLRDAVADFLTQPGQTGAFVFAGSTYVVNAQTTDPGYHESTDLFVELTGLTTAVGLSTTAGVNLIHIA